MAAQFTPFASTFGGALIGVAAVIWMLFNGRISGISGILGSLLPPSQTPQLQKQRHSYWD
jgi:uncharacterized protein